MKLIVIDDFSDEIVVPSKDKIDIVYYRITDDIAWNQAGARNLGCILSETDWSIFFDIDQIPNETGLQYIFNKLEHLNKNTLYYFNVSNFIDSNLNVELQVHPNTFLVHTNTFKSKGMYDEDFVGNYGYEDLYLPYVWEHFGGKREILGSEPFFTDQHIKTSNLDRSTEINHKLALKKINDGITPPKNFLRFQWIKLM
jgi:predicted glycosyltransferase involved in capsule biosynthesis